MGRVLVPLEVDASSSTALDADRALAELPDQLFKEELATMKQALSQKPVHSLQHAELFLGTLVEAKVND